MYCILLLDFGLRVLFVILSFARNLFVVFVWVCWRPVVVLLTWHYACVSVWAF